MSPGSPGEGLGASYVQALGKGLAVIKAFGADTPQLTLSELARKVGFSRATARRYLLTLEALGYVDHVGRSFALRPRVLELGYAYLSSIQLPALALPHLETLVAQVKESSSISVLDATEIVYIARVPTSRIMTVNINVGTRFPAIVTSMGRVLLSALPADERRRRMEGQLIRHTARTVTDRAELESMLEGVRGAGWAAVDQELEEGLRSIAVPIHDAAGQVIAATNISAHSSRVSMEELESFFLQQLRATAVQIEHDLRQLPPSAGSNASPGG